MRVNGERCQYGIRVAYMYIILDTLGYSVQNYDESFYRWCNIYLVE